MPDDLLTEIRAVRTEMQSGFHQVDTRLSRLEEADGLRAKHEEFERGYKAAKQDTAFSGILSWKNIAAIGTILGLIAGFLTVIDGVKP